MKWIKGIAIGLGVLLAVLLAVPFFISLDDYIPTIEKEVSAKLGEPMRIGSLKVAALPLPHLTVDGISVGKTADIRVGKVTVTPDLWSLLGSPKVIRSIEIEGLMLTQKGIDKIPAWTKGEKKPGEPPAVIVKSIKLDDAMVKLEKAALGPFDARISLSGSGQFESAALSTRDDKLKVLVKPEKSRYVIDAVAKEWKLPAGPPIHFDELIVKGVATLNDAHLTDVRARLYGGTVKGRTTIGWQRGFQLNGKAAIHQVELRSLVPLLTKGAKVSGRLDADPVFSANAPSAARLMDALRLETAFEVQNGVLYGVDISKAATSIISKDGAKGGETRFDELSGHVVLDRRTYRFTKLKIASGSLAADGSVSISPEQELSGRINAKATKLATVPLNVSGTVQSPLLLPTGATVAGAAVGTAILGPGVGTTIGTTIGSTLSRIFGGGDSDEEKKK